MKSTESKTSGIIESADNYLSKHIDAGTLNRVLVAYSAGPDSTALLDCLYFLREKYSMVIEAAYFNHCMRKEEEIEKEIETAVKRCAERGIKLHIGKDSENRIAETSSSLGPEAAAREARYSFLEKTGLENSCSYIATAHNVDDNLETIIMRFFSGSGPEGLKGIAEKTGKIIRPFINVKKDDILEYLKMNSIEYSYDSTNSENKYLRNLLRHSLIPSIKTVFPGFEKSLFELAEKMKHTDLYLSEEAGKKVTWERQGNGFKTDFRNFSALSPCLRAKAIYSVFNLLSVASTYRLPYRFLRPITSETISLKSPVILKGYGCRLIKRGDNLFWESDIVNKNKNSYLLFIETGKEYRLAENKGITENKNVYIYSSIMNLSQCAGNSVWLPINKVSGRIHIRNRRKGDKILLKYGKKSLKKLFQEMNIDRDQRDDIHLICDDKGIAAVWGSVYSYKNRIAERFKIESSNNDIQAILFNSRQE